GYWKIGIGTRKLAATFSSTGNPSFFIHPTEASHGDLDIPYICITENPSSTIAKSANVYISIHKTQEACALGAPTTSTTAALIIGDALAISLARAKNFNVKKFSFLHPGDLDFRNTNIKTVMTSTFKIIHPNILASKALEEMKYSNYNYLLI
ncbi:hypothetical protein GQX74_015787, partial [Glossina fuscipes]